MWATLEQGKTYTIQAVSELPWASIHAGPAGTATLWIHNAATETHKNFIGDGVTAGFHSWTFTFTEATSSQVRIRINTYSCGGKFWNFKIEEGSEATEWWPA